MLNKLQAEKTSEKSTKSEHEPSSNLNDQEEKTTQVGSPFIYNNKNMSMNKDTSKHNSPLSRRITKMENEDIQECSFRPKIGKLTEILAEKARQQRSGKEIGLSLYEDSQFREIRKLVQEKTVIFQLLSFSY